MTTAVEAALMTTCVTCRAPVGTECAPPPEGFTRGRLHNRRVKDGRRLRMSQLVAQINASPPAPSVTLLDTALRAIAARAIETWDPPDLVTLVRLPLSHPDEATRRKLRGRVKSLCIDIAIQLHAGEPAEKVDHLIDRAVARIIRLDSDHEQLPEDKD